MLEAAPREHLNSYPEALGLALEMITETICDALSEDFRSFLGLEKGCQLGPLQYGSYYFHHYIYNYHYCELLITVILLLFIVFHSYFLFMFFSSASLGLAERPR